MTKVRQDEHGIYIKAGGYIARPGNVTGFDVALRMDDGGLVPGMEVKAKHLGGNPITRLVLETGQKLFWHHEHLGPGSVRSFDYDPEKYGLDGKRDFAKVPVVDAGLVHPRPLTMTRASEMLSKLQDDAAEPNSAPTP